MPNLTPLEQEMLAALKIAQEEMVRLYHGAKNRHESPSADTIEEVRVAIAKAEPKPRRWIVEEKDHDGQGYVRFQDSSGSTPIIIIREMKPITQEQVTAALYPPYCEPTQRLKYVNFLRNLGIDVED